MNTIKSPLTTISTSSFDDMSLQVAELQSLLSAITDLGNHDNQTGCLVSAAERLANLLQADIQALHVAYRRQHPATAIQQGGE